MSSLYQDIRLAFRVMLKQPAFSLTILACLALGTGVNTAIFSLVNSVVLRPLAFESPEQLIILQSERKPENYPIVMRGVDLPNFTDWQSQNDVCAALGAFAPTEWTLTGAARPVRLNAGYATADFFKTLGVEAALGRLLTDEDVEGQSGNVAVLSDSLWRGQFGADPNIVGRSILLDQENFTVIGVLPPGFRFPYLTRDAQIWTPVPIHEQFYASRSNGMLNAVGRLKAGVTLPQAQTQFDTIAARLAQEYPNVNPGYRIELVGLRNLLIGESRASLWMLLGAVGLVLLIACVNVANLFLSRSLDRRRELAVRAALGAGRARLVRQVLTESAILGLIGGACGFMLAYWCTSALAALLPADLPRIDEIAVDGRVLAFSTIVALLSGLLFGLPAALNVTRTELHDTLKSGGRRTGAVRHRLQNVLVVGEIATAMVLLIGAGLLIRSFRTVTAINPGYVTENVLTFQMDINATTPYPQHADFFEGVCQRLRGLPSVRDVCFSNGLPLTDQGLRTSVKIVDAPDSSKNKIPFSVMRAVSTEYFTTMGIPLLQGRLFDDGDARGQTGVALIDETMARRYWPDEDPIGKRLRPGATIGTARVYEIVGVVGTVRDDGLDVDALPNLYVPYRMYPDGSVILTLRTSGNPLALIENVRETVANATALDAPFAFATLDEYLNRAVAHRRYPMFLLGLFATLALLLAALGIYGVLAYSVAQRTHEIGVRQALGAQTAQVLRLVLGQGLRLTLFGIGLGLVGALAGARLLKSWLFGVKATDPLTFGLAAAAFVAIALLACYVPARQATKVDPMTALRCE